MCYCVLHELLLVILALTGVPLVGLLCEVISAVLVEMKLMGKATGLVYATL